MIRVRDVGPIPRCLLTLGLLIGVGYMVVALLGWREYTTVLSGTLPTGDKTLDCLRALAYLAMYFGAIVLAPICALAAGILVVLEKLCGGVSILQEWRGSPRRGSTR